MFYLISIPIILIGLDFGLPYKQGKKKLAFTISVRRESYEKLKEGYSPNYDVITLSKTNNILTFERIND